MATHKSAVKRHRQDLKRRSRNRAHRTKLRTQVKKLRKALATGDVAQAKELLPGTLALVDHTAKLGVIHDNAAARTKSRISRAVNRAASA